MSKDRLASRGEPVTFYQHVFGRVARGREGASGGHQVAALSCELQPLTDVVARLNRLSFYTYRGSDILPRYSFVRPADGWLALGRVVMATDRSGKRGAFAHHFVCAERDFVRSTLLPADLLRRLPFLSSEQELGEDRVLPPVEVDGDEPRHTVGPVPPRVLHLLDRLLSDDRLHVPLATLTDQEFWPFLSAVHGLLPRAEIASLTFSTLFCQCAEFVEDYRLVTVPTRSFAQGLPDVLEVLDLDASPLGPEHPLTQFARQHAAAVPLLLTLINGLRHDGPPATNDQLRTLVACGRDFREVVERLAVPGVLPWLMTDLAMFDTYWNAGRPLAYHELRDALWHRPAECLPVFLQFLARLENGELHGALWAELTQRMIANSEADSNTFWSQLTQTRLRDVFLQWCGDRLPPSDLARFTQRLRGMPGYRGGLHRIVARRLVSRGEFDAADWQWLSQERDLDRLADAVVTWREALNAPRSDSIDWGRFELGVEDWRGFVHWAWNDGLRARIEPTQLVQKLQAPGRELPVVMMAAQWAMRLDADSAAGFLATLITMSAPSPAVEQYVLELIERQPNARVLAESLSKQLEKSSQVTRPFLQGLRRLTAQRSTSFFRRLFGGGGR